MAWAGTGAITWSTGWGKQGKNKCGCRGGSQRECGPCRDSTRYQHRRLDLGSRCDGRHTRDDCEPPFDRWHIGAAWDIDAEEGFTALIFVIALNFLTQLARLDADNGVVARIVVGRAVENLQTEWVLFQAVLSARKRLFDDVAEQFLELMGVAKPAAFEEPFELGEHLT